MIARRRYAIDTHLYIDALRTEQGKAVLNAFHTAFTPFIYLCSVVAHELLAGASGEASERVEDGLLSPFERRGRVFTPSHAAWKDAARVLAELIGPKEWRTVGRGFVNDALLAMACREAGVTLITDNTRDFARIDGVRHFDFVPAWPQL